MIDKPEPVSRVAPPRAIIPSSMTQMVSSQLETRRLSRTDMPSITVESETGEGAEEGAVALDMTPFSPHLQP
ncbi:hypothetical protein AOE01nite_30870 [Acetobacter oeni]|uniref:Uncharacterized protein n=1 Tax=Acetobacter oeni TaxID=304077 RepID=A0A511XPH7_9PROT|nr:hypothetical protein AA21952_2682 [Acetobacter oeni LMG 21952]GEN64863.1 hypothetical protein AOE01nite_30870 [Acetobacter oeni]